MQHVTYRKRKITLKQMLRSSRQLPAQNTSDALAHLADPELLSYLQVSVASLSSRKGKEKSHLSLGCFCLDGQF